MAIQTKAEIQEQLARSADNMQKVRQRKEAERVAELLDVPTSPTPISTPTTR